MIKPYIGVPGQTAIDAAIMLTGSIEGIKTIFEHNANVLDAQSIDELTLKYEPTIIDGSIVKYFENKVIVTK